jgi:hypothetical protein
MFCPSDASETLENQEGAGNAGCRNAPAALRAKWKKARTQVVTGTPNIPAFPAQWFYGLFRALVSANFARMCERAVLTNRPSLDLSPIVLEGLESLSGSVGQTRCLPQPEQLHGPFEPGPSKEGSG